MLSKPTYQIPTKSRRATKSKPSKTNPTPHKQPKATEATKSPKPQKSHKPEAKEAIEAKSHRSHRSQNSTPQKPQTLKGAEAAGRTKNHKKRNIIHDKHMSSISKWQHSKCRFPRGLIKGAQRYYVILWKTLPSCRSAGGCLGCRILTTSGQGCVYSFV